MNAFFPPMHPPMFATTENHPRLLRSSLTASALTRVLLEPVAIIGTLLACAQAYGENFEGPYLILALIVFSLTFPGDTPVSTSPRRLLREVVVGWLAIAGLLLFVGWATRTLVHFPLEVMFAWGLATPLVLFSLQLLLPALLPRLLSAEGVHRKAVIVGASELGRRLATHMQTSPLLGIRFSGYFDDRAHARLGDADAAKCLGKLGDLPDYARTHKVDLIYITLPMASQPRILKLLEGLRDTTASVYFTPDIFLFDLIQARMDTIGGIPVVAVCETPFYGVNGLVKRLSDLFIATLILALISPVMLAIAVGVKASSPGPVLFRQRRYGLDGREIIIYKFRSMTVCEDGAVIRQATKGDQRVTRLGAFLRSTSLDELPQFINVLQGRMSVVGPRPHAVSHNEMYRKLITGYMIRHKVKPGITGWAQVNGLRGETDTLDKMQGRIEYDLAYLRNWSLRFDLEIILKTVTVVIRDRHAY
jgi:putative colanic acid biosynthesis UDP-glucose lipid carrier transferase